MKSRVVIFSLLVSALASLATAQSRAGGEFRVNAYTTGSQTAAAAAARRDGSWMVAWESEGEDGSSTAAMARHFDRLGVAHGAVFTCNTYTTGAQGAPAVSTSAKAAVVAWHSRGGQDGDGSGVYGQRLDSTHETVGAEFRVNTFTLNYQYAPSIAASGLGNFVVAWESYNEEGSNYGVIARRFDALGNALSGEFRVNTYTTAAQVYPSVAGSVDGHFVVAWASNNQDGARYGIFAQRYDPSGVKLGAEFRVNTYTPNDQQGASAAMADDHSFVVVWQSADQDGSGTGIFGQLYNPNGTPNGPEFAVNTFTTGDQSEPSVGMDAEGDFAVAWRSQGQDGDAGAVTVRRFLKGGVVRGQEFRGNTTVAGDQGLPALAADRVGNLAVFWTSAGQDGSSDGVYGQRFGGLLPAPVIPTNPFPTLAVDPTGNSVFEPGETVAVQPAWENVSGAAESATGLMTDFKGPAGASYIIADDTGAYGIIPAEEVHSCTFSGNCYSLTVTAPPTRPVLHWDSTVLETLAPANQGQAKRWTLHLGDSFGDVPRTSPYYRFVETMLHVQITNGCPGNNYCPTGPTTREAMAVFVLLAKEGPGYAPPACTTPIFADVPAASPYCRYIEELYRRGVAGGCGTNPLRYCPSSDVTREQMSVFLLRTLDPTLNPVACTTQPYEDVPITNPFCRWITELVARGITSGCGDGRYCPTAVVTREQMSVFLTVTFGLLLYSGA